MIRKARYAKVRTLLADTLHQLDAEVRAADHKGEQTAKATIDAIKHIEQAAITLVKAQTGPAHPDAILEDVRADRTKRGAGKPAETKAS